MMNEAELGDKIKGAKSGGHYVFLTFIAFLGTSSAGCTLGGNTGLADVWAVQLNWGENQAFYTTVVSTFGVLGLAIGSILSEMVTKHGRRAAILWSNLAICVITVPYFFLLNIWVLSITRFCLGVLSAIIINATSLYIAEAVPAKYRTQVGSAVNFGIVFGIWVMGVFGLFLPTLTDP